MLEPFPSRKRICLGLSSLPVGVCPADQAVWKLSRHCRFHPGVSPVSPGSVSAFRTAEPSPSQMPERTRTILCLDAHLKLQRIDQFPFSSLHFCQFLCQCLLTLRYHVLGCRLLCFLYINGTAGIFFQVLCHLPGYLFTLTDQVGWVAQLMAFRMPKKIQKEQVILPGKESGPSAYHLAVQAPDLCRPQHHNTIHARAVPPLCKKHGIAKHVVSSDIKLL